MSWSPSDVQPLFNVNSLPPWTLEIIIVAAAVILFAIAFRCFMIDCCVGLPSLCCCCDMRCDCVDRCCINRRRTARRAIVDGIALKHAPPHMKLRESSAAAAV